ncbi:MAG: Bacterial dnaA protein helix-turn-helix [Candidatus Saccharibacteria bacterium]|nr:Bacterial dnaA protein helix-turn-helix [Candidatus Saccharibacteria bacterium]MDB5716423.1 Bacterial dnaA protein helix-turn-helix [Sphingomonadales bacterium]
MDDIAHSVRDGILAVVSREYKISRTDLLSVTRGKKAVAEARMLAMWMFWMINGKNASSAGRVFDRDPTTALHGIQKVQKSPKLRQEAKRLLGIFRNGTTPPKTVVGDKPMVSLP